MKRLKTITVVLLFCIACIPAYADSEWGEEWVYTPSSFKLDYSYATIAGGQETFPINLGVSYIVPFLEHRNYGEILALSIGETFGGNWKNTHFRYTKDNYDYDLVSKFYWMQTIGLECGFMALQLGMGVCATEFSKTGITQYNPADGVYYTPVELHKSAFFIMEPAAYVYIPISEGYKVGIKIAYQYVPIAPIMNGLVIGGSIRFGDLDI